jgi:predicted PurR-regulated permease PerM
MPEKRDYKKYFSWALILVLAISAYFIIRDYIVAIVSSFVLAYLLLPLQKRMSKKINPKLSSIILLSLVVIAIVLPLALIANTLFSELSTLVSADSEPLSQRIQNFISDFPLLENLSPYIPEVLSRLEELAIEALYSTLTYIPNLAITIMLTFFISFFLLFEWDKIKKQTIRLIPFENKEKLIQKIQKTSNQIVYGTLLIAFIEFLFAVIMFSIGGISFSVLLAFIMAVLVFIPLLGPGFVWVPLMIFELAVGNYYAAVIVLITGLVAGLVIEELLRSIIVGRKAQIHPVIMLIGVLGGVQLFGLFGFIIGPVLLSFLYDFIIQAIEDKKIKQTTLSSKYKKRKNKP